MNGLAHPSLLQHIPTRFMRMNLLIPSPHRSTLQDLWTFLLILVAYLEIVMQQEKFWVMKVW